MALHRRIAGRLTVFVPVAVVAALLAALPPASFAAAQTVASVTTPRDGATGTPVSGRVYDIITGAVPCDTVYVTAYDLKGWFDAGTDVWGIAPTAHVTADADGRYSMLLPPGTYSILADVGCGVGDTALLRYHHREWYVPGSPDNIEGDACEVPSGCVFTPLHVGATPIGGIDIGLDPIGRWKLAVSTTRGKWLTLKDRLGLLVPWSARIGAPNGMSTYGLPDGLKVEWSDDSGAVLFRGTMDDVFGQGSLALPGGPCGVIPASGEMGYPAHIPRVVTMHLSVIDDPSQQFTSDVPVDFQTCDLVPVVTDLRQTKSSKGHRVIEFQITSGQALASLPVEVRLNGRLVGKRTVATASAASGPGNAVSGWQSLVLPVAPGRRPTVQVLVLPNSTSSSYAVKLRLGR